MDLNLGTTVRVTNATLDLLGKDKGGNGAVLVHTASNGGLIPAFFAPFYCATKAAMVHYTRSWAHEVNYQSHGVRMFTICPRMTDTDFLQQNADPKKVVKLDHLLTVMNFSDKTKMLSPSAVGEALIKGLEDDSLNGVALQLLTDEPRVLFVDQNSLIVTSDSVTTGLAQKATQ
jgi:NAD(P)-dependent dehydrogenase (short-subunit alcohol dehydrogenase family)